jgi:DNA-binding winged helix-turn-helix (wHTH) protein
VQHTVHLFDGFQLDVTRRKLVSSGGLVQSLNSRAMDALLLLVDNAGELVEKRRLMQTIWPNAIVEDNNLNQCILAIRKALGEVAGSNRYIMTVPGRGYRFVSPVRTVTQESAGDAATAAPPRWSSQAPWMGVFALAATCTTLLILLLRSVTHGPAEAQVQVQAQVPQTATTPEGGLPGIILRLRETSTAGGAADGSGILLTQCLMAGPTMKLRVQLQLVEETGAPLWTGEYLAGAQDLLVAQFGANATLASCRDLIAITQRQQAKLAVH